jgi:hypothetical protein
MLPNDRVIRCGEHYLVLMTQSGGCQVRRGAVLQFGRSRKTSPLLAGSVGREGDAMKWIEKELVVGTKPPIRIGRRVFKSTDGSQKSTETFWATFSVGTKQRFVSMQVFKREDAIREAHRLARRLEDQTQPLAERTNIKLGEIVD